MKNLLLMIALILVSTINFFGQQVTELSNKRSFFDSSLAKRQRPLNADELIFYRNKLTAQLENGNAKLLNSDKVREMILPVLKIYNREQIEIFYYDSPMPSINLYAESFLIITKPAAELLKADLLKAAIAHELAHEVYSQELFKAQKENDPMAQEAVETLCDQLGAVALVLLNEEALNVSKAVKKIESAEVLAAKKYNLQINVGTHSGSEKREKLLKDFLVKFN